MRSFNPSPRVSATAGFSLIEMLVVLAIVSVVAGVAAVSVRQARSGKSPYTYAGDIAEGMMAQRYRAMNTGRIQTSEIDIESKTIFDTGGRTVVALPGNWRLSVTAGQSGAKLDAVPKIMFLPDGTSSGAEITLRNQSGEAAYVRVNWLTGLTEYSSHAF
jgi:general secretion pathway protein H